MKHLSVKLFTGLLFSVLAISQVHSRSTPMGRCTDPGEGSGKKASFTCVK